MQTRNLLPFFFKAAFAKVRGRDDRRLTELRQHWGREISRERNMGVIAMYHASVSDDCKTVDNQTWQDLGMDDLFAKIDRTAGMPGRQILYHEMRTYVDDDRILAQSRTPLELGTGLPATRCALRFGPWELTEGEWRLVLGVSPQVADRAPGATWRHYHRHEAAPSVRVVTPNPQELRVAMPIPCRWEV